MIQPGATIGLQAGADDCVVIAEIVGVLSPRGVGLAQPDQRDLVGEAAEAGVDGITKGLARAESGGSWPGRVAISKRATAAVPSRTSAKPIAPPALATNK